MTLRSPAWERRCARKLILTNIAGPRIHMRPVSGFPLIHVEYPKFEVREHFTKRKGDLVILFRTVKTVVMPDGAA